MRSNTSSYNATQNGSTTSGYILTRANGQEDMLEVLTLLPAVAAYWLYFYLLYLVWGLIFEKIGLP